jgi:hypothetical protein
MRVANQNQTCCDLEQMHSQSRETLKDCLVTGLRVASMFADIAEDYYQRGKPESGLRAMAQADKSIATVKRWLASRLIPADLRQSTERHCLEVQMRLIALFSDQRRS